MIPVICIEMLYPDLSFEDRIEKIADVGFRHIEFWGWRDKNLSAIKDVCGKKNITITNFSGQRVGDLINIDTHEILINDYKDALKCADLLGVKTLMVLTNELGDGGAVINSYAAVSPDRKKESVIAGLKKLMKITPTDMTIVMEPLNTVTDHKGYFLNDMDTASEIISEVDDFRLKILCDLYHQKMMGDNLSQLIETHVENIGYFHIADVPGRHEPGTGKVSWEKVLKEIKRNKYNGYIGFEYSPVGNSSKSLERIMGLWNSL